MILTRDQAKGATRVSLADGDHLVLTAQQVFSDGQSMTLRRLEKPLFKFSVWPSLSSTQGTDPRVETLKDDGIFKSYRAEGISHKVNATWVPERSSTADFVPVPMPRQFQLRQNLRKRRNGRSRFRKVPSSE